ncbi:putative mannan synthase 9 isoform X1 [Canna indica]|uniref:glucomannan 4-beta-mannosyltransferase n=1 Tax=Canna indica TaxID=4628 RepID=A0AAQ3L540_9LILI|nr:putative mannan synthase 9 isoform X1 [Canna indica]
MSERRRLGLDFHGQVFLHFLSASSISTSSFNLAASLAEEGNAQGFSGGRVLGFFGSLWSAAPFGFGEVQLGLTWEQAGDIWVRARGGVVAPVLRIAVALCMVMSVMLVFEKILMGATSLFSKVFSQWRPRRRYKFEPIGEDLEVGYPTVLVQIPMYNEKQVYKLSIGAACGLSWPLDRLIIQVLDDSTDPEIKNLVEEECKTWRSKGFSIKYEIRDNRHGYKAGALKEGMKHSYVGQCDFVVIFDADFQPETDFLIETIPFLIHNPDIALVQTRWKFVNSNECMITRIQEMSMDYHFKVEQESGSTMYSFFGFNGTAGVWRISALEEAGGWKDRTTVEDMDLAVRATLCGWKFVYLGNVKVKSELPSTLKALRSQQFRWSCGPANLFRKIHLEILKTKKVAAKKKIYLIYSFFIVRRILSHTVTFMFYCVVIPFSVFVPEVKVTPWGVVYIPTTITLLNSVGTPSSFHLLLFWIFYENVMSMHRMRAVMTGLFETGKVNEWVVTKKLGNKSQEDKTEQPCKQSTLNISGRFLLPELGMALYLFICACYDFRHGKNNYCFYIFPQAITFFIVGIGYVGTFIPS